MLKGWKTHFSVDIVTLVLLYMVRGHAQAQFLGLVRQTAFREKKLPEANAPRCAASGDFLQHTRQRPCKHRKAVFFCAMERGPVGAVDFDGTGALAAREFLLAETEDRGGRNNSGDWNSSNESS
jgi:hypothetical protein